jgi:L-threonylcarbamoyladenylate synthase
VKAQILPAVDPESVGRAADILRSGGLVAFPTETVYGLGGLGLSNASLERIFAAKGRPYSDPLILHAADAEQAWGVTEEITPQARALAARFWPGPLTLVLRRADAVPLRATAGRDSVAVRVPAHPVALALLREVAAPLAAPSANRFGHVSPTTAEHVLADLDDAIDAVLDAGPTPVGVESTVLDARSLPVVILRPGGVSRVELETALGRGSVVSCDHSEAGEIPRSPGRLDTHYSPRAQLRLFRGESEAVLNAWTEALKEAEPGSVGVLAVAEDLARLPRSTAPVGDLGSGADAGAVAARLYAALRELDARGVRAILARLLPGDGLADAVNDRLTRAAGGRIRDV